MAPPLVVNLPHQLGKDEARRRIEANMHRLADHIPGGGADVKSAWQGDVLNLSVAALGQEVTSRIEVQDKLVRIEVVLPALLGMFGKQIGTFLSRKGGELLEDKSKK